MEFIQPDHHDNEQHVREKTKKIELIQILLILVNQLAAYEILKVATSLQRVRVRVRQKNMIFQDLEKLNRRRTRSNYEPSFLTEEGIQRSETYIEESEEYKQYCRNTFGYHD